MANKKTKILGYGKPTTVEVEIYMGAVIVDDEDRAKEVLEMMEAASAAAKPINDFIAEAKKQVTAYQVTHSRPVVQLDNGYYRKVQRMTRFWVATPKDMPSPKPKGAKSLKEICKDKLADGKPLWNFITRRVPDKTLMDLAVKRGYVTADELGKAYVEKPQAAFIQRYDGQAFDDEEEDG